MIKTLRVKVSNWWRKFRKLDCPNCKTVLGDFGYCDSCNDFPYRQWITDAEALYMSDVDFMRKDPEGYETYEREMRKITIKYLLTKREHHTREFIAGCYGEDLVAEVERDLEQSNKDDIMDA